MSMTREVPVNISTLFTAGTPATTKTIYHTSINGVDWDNGTDVKPTSFDAADPNVLETYTLVNNTVVTKPEGATKVIVSYSEGGLITEVTFYKTSEEFVPGTSDSYNYNGTVDYDANNVNSKAKIYDCVTLDDDERYVIEAGAYLAYKPAADKVNVVGNQIIGFQEDQEDPSATNVVDGAYQNIGTKTDFTPHADGLYVFRRKIVVNTEGNAAGTETFEYDGYYYLGGRYYKIMNLKVTQDNDPVTNSNVDTAADGVTTDGQLADATACLVKEEKVYGVQPESFRYDAANNRIVVSYKTNTENGLVGTETNLTTLAADLDEAEHNLQEAEVLLERAIADSGIVAGSVNEKTKAVDAAQLAYNKALADYDKAVAAYKQALENYNIGKDAFTNAQTKAQTALTDLVGTTATNTVTGIPAEEGAILAADPDKDNVSIAEDGVASLTNPLKKAVTGTDGKVTYENAGNITISTKDTGSPAYAYIKALKDYKDWTQRYLITGTDPVSGNTEAIDHQIYVYLKELYKDRQTVVQDDPAKGNYYTPKADSKITAANLAADSEDVPAGVTHEDLVNELKYAATRITYKYAVAHIAWIPSTDPNATSELHKYHTLLTALNIAEKNYNDKLAAYNTAIGNLNKAIGDLNSPVDAPTGSAFKPIDNATEVTATYITDTLQPWESGDAKTLKDAYADLTGDSSTDETQITQTFTVKTEKQIQEWTDQLNGKEGALQTAWKNLKAAEKDLADIDNETYLDPNTGLPAPVPDGVTPNPDNMDNPQVKENLKAAWDNYYAKKNAVDELERKLNAAQNGFEKDGDLLIYIYLTDNVTLTGDTAGKWQLLPTDINTNKEAVFYYTSILGAGEVSSQLIDYVELDESVNQYMYKYFDFDLNVTLDSTQVHFNEDGSRSTQAADKEFDYIDGKNKKHDVSGKIQNPTVGPKDGTKNETVVTWSESTADNNQQQQPGGGEQQSISATFNGTPVTLTPSTVSGKLWTDNGDVASFAYEFELSGRTYYIQNITDSPIGVFVLSSAGDYYVLPSGDRNLQLT